MIQRPAQRGISVLKLLLILAGVALLVYLPLTWWKNHSLETRNETRNETIAEYIRALELVRKDGGGRYPQTDGVCLGEYDDNYCWLIDFEPKGDVKEDVRFNARLGSFTSLTTLEDFAVVRGVREDGTETAYEGMIYRAPEGSRFYYEIVWLLEGEDALCLYGAKATPAFDRFNITQCVYTHRP